MEQRFSFALKLRKIGKRKALWKMTITFSGGICYHKYWNQRVVCFAERKSSWSKLFFYSGPRTKIKTQCSLLRRKIQYKKAFWSQKRCSDIWRGDTAVEKYGVCCLLGVEKFSVQGVQTRLKRNDRFEISDRVANW